MIIEQAGLSDRRITLEHLRAFVAVSECGGFHNAGLRLCRSQSAVTQNLQKLEEYLDCQLLNRRQGHVLGLTGNGARLLPEARKILASLDNVLGVLRQPELRGRINLGIPDNFNAFELQNAITACMGMNRGLRIEVVASLSAQLSQMLEQGKIDAAVLYCCGDPLQEGDILLKEERLFWVSAKPELPAADQEIPLVAFSEGCAYREAIMRSLEQAGKPYYFAYSSNSYESVRNAIGAGFGVGVLPQQEFTAGCKVIADRSVLPELPPGKLFLRVKSRSAVIRQFCDYIKRLPSLAVTDVEAQA